MSSKESREAYKESKEERNRKEAERRGKKGIVSGAYNIDDVEAMVDSYIKPKSYETTHALLKTIQEQAKLKSYNPFAENMVRVKKIVASTLKSSPEKEKEILHQIGGILHGMEKKKETENPLYLTLKGMNDSFVKGKR